MIGEFERDDVSVKVWRLWILLLDLVVVVERRLAVVVVLLAVVVVVTVDDEETSSRSSGTADDGGGGEVARFFDESSGSFSFQMRRDTAQRWICRLDLIVSVVLLLFDVERKLSADGVRFVNVSFGEFCWPIAVNDG